jgi:hypothetical protein
MLFFAINAKNDKINKYGETYDIGPTILQILKIKHNYKFAKSMGLLN